MFKSLTRLGAAFIAALALSLPTAASTFSIDYTDLWGGGPAGQANPTENGWGLNLVQQGDVIFATMFVYGPDNSARWFSASALNPTGSTTTWSGSLAETRGPYFAAAWNNAQVVPTVVGTMSITFDTANAGRLQYTVNGLQINKNISRFSLRAANLGGRYLGGAVATCTNQSQVLIFDTLRVTQNGNALAMQIDFFNGQGVASTCTYNGTLNTTGRTGSITGTYSCTFGTAPGNAGNFTLTNLESSINGFNATLQASDQFCTSMTGRFGGVKDVIQ
ncbi:MAG: hypothetical protein H7Y14_09670 [Burkholderiales bacterium]|nr:hypothetical protein [Burkholderiales bacterium]